MNIVNDANSIINSIVGLITISSAIAAVFSAKKSKEYEKKAQEYADNANESNISAKRYYDEMLLTLEKQKSKMEADELEEKVYTYIVNQRARGTMLTTEDISDNLNIDFFKVTDILIQMFYSKRIATYVNCDINSLRCQWKPA